MSQSPPAAHKLLPLLLDNLQEYALFMTDAQGMVVSWTPGVLRLLGYEEAEFIGMDSRALYRREDRDLAIPEIELTRAEMDGRAEDVRWYRRKDGSLIWANGQMIALREDDGDIQGFAKILRDDTGRKQVEEALRDTRLRLQSALDVGGIGTWVWDIPADRVVADPNLARFFNVSPEDAAGGPIANYIRSIHPDDVERVFAAINESIENDQTFSEDYRLLQADGSLVWVEARGKIDKDATGMPTYLNGVVVDITGRKKVEADFLQSEERYRILFDALENGFCVLQMIFGEDGKCVDYRFVETNPAFEGQTGLKNAIGKTARQLVPGLDEYWFQTYGHVARTGTPIRFEQWAEAMGRWFEVYAFRAGAAENARVALLFTDITDRRRGEAALRQAHIQSEETNRIKDEFLATLSHELRTPLNSILGWANLLRTNEIEAATQQKGLETIERNARAQAQLINDLLDVSRILTGKMRLDLRQVELAELVENAVRNVLPSTEAKGIQLETEIDHSIGLISGDADRLQQVFWNLLANAIKFTPRGGTILVRMSLQQSQAEVQIIDTGKGIDPEFLPYVFERFRQADASSTRSYGGLGIGLALVRHLMEAHGGTVRVYSAGEGKGSTFTVSFPLRALRDLPEVEEEPRLDSAAEIALPEKQVPLESLEGLSVLIVEDEPDALEMLQLALTKRGAQVYGANSVHSAFKEYERSRLNEKPFDILVSDIGLPEEDGYSLMRRIRNYETAHGGFLPAIALTAYAGQKDRMDSLLAGFQVHIAKPADSMELVATVASLAGRTGHDLD